MMDSEPSQNQDLNSFAQGASTDSTRLDDKIKALQKLLNELRDKVSGLGGAGYTFGCKPVQSQLDVQSLLEKELPSKYVPVSCFMCLHILLDFAFRYRFNKFTLSVSYRTKCDNQCLKLFDFWAGKAKQKVVPSLLLSIKPSRE